MIPIRIERLSGRSFEVAEERAVCLVCTRLVIPDDQQALTIGGKRARLKRRDFEALASYAGLPSRAAESVLVDHQRAEAGAVALIEQSYLDNDRKRAYREILTENTRLLNA